MDVEKLIKDLTELRGVSGNEKKAADAVCDIVRPLCDEVYQNKLGSVVAIKRCGIKNAKKVMIDAHIDEIGLMVTDIHEKGFVSFTEIGGTDMKTLLSSVVTIHGQNEDVTGIIGAIPPHLAKEDDEKIKADKLSIDTGLPLDVLKEKIEIGDPISFDYETITMGSCMAGKTMDDRASVAAMILCLSKLQNTKLNVDVYMVGAVQEEVGLRGAITAAYEINPDLAIAIDVCHAKTPDNSENAFEMGKGIVLTMGPSIHPGVYDLLLKIAKDYNVPHQIEACGGNTGTDAWGIQIAQNGIPTALLSLPLKYMHSSVETLAISDVKNTAKLLEFTLKEMSVDLEEVFSCKE